MSSEMKKLYDTSMFNSIETYDKLMIYVTERVWLNKTKEVELVIQQGKMASLVNEVYYIEKENGERQISVEELPLSSEMFVAIYKFAKVNLGWYS